MDFINVVRTGDSVTFSVNWEAVLNAVNTFTVGEWVLILLGLNFLYGIITHLRSTTQVYKWNDMLEADFQKRLLEWRTSKERWKIQPGRDKAKPIQEWDLLPIAFYRVFFNLPGRIVTFFLGFIGMILLFGVSGRFRINRFLKWGWGWYLRPHRLRAILNSPGGLTDF